MSCTNTLETRFVSSSCVPRLFYLFIVSYIGHYLSCTSPYLCGHCAAICAVIVRFIRSILRLWGLDHQRSRPDYSILPNIYTLNVRLTLSGKVWHNTQHIFFTIGTFAVYKFLFVWIFVLFFVFFRWQDQCYILCKPHCHDKANICKRDYFYALSR